MTSEHRLRELEEKYEGYKVYDNRGEKIGKVDDLFVDDADREEYIGVKLGFLGRKSTLIPIDIVRVNERDKSVEVSESKDHVKNAPSFDDDEDITPDYEERIRSHFGLGASESSGSRGSYGAYSGGEGEREGDHDHSDRDTSSEEYRGRSEDRSDESSATPAASTGTAQGGVSGRESGSGESSGEERLEQEGSSQEGSRRSPMTRQTEETETFEEGGRTKVRRRIIREEIVEEDANDR